MTLKYLVKYNEYKNNFKNSKFCKIIQTKKYKFLKRRMLKLNNWTRFFLFYCQWYLKISSTIKSSNISFHLKEQEWHSLKGGLFLPGVGIKECRWCKLIKKMAHWVILFSLSFSISWILITKSKLESIWLNLYFRSCFEN